MLPGLGVHYCTRAVSIVVFVVKQIPSIIVGSMIILLPAVCIVGAHFQANMATMPTSGAAQKDTTFLDDAV